MNEFEEMLDSTVRDSTRLVSETLQLENFIFSEKGPDVLADIGPYADTFSDWVLRLKDHGEKKAQKELYELVHLDRAEIVDQNNCVSRNTSKGLIRRSK
jgi:phosphopentomutase